MKSLLMMCLLSVSTFSPLAVATTLPSQTCIESRENEVRQELSKNTSVRDLKVSFSFLPGQGEGRDEVHFVVGYSFVSAGNPLRPSRPVAMIGFRTYDLNCNETLTVRPISMGIL